MGGTKLVMISQTNLAKDEGVKKAGRIITSIIQVNEVGVLMALIALVATTGLINPSFLSLGNIIDVLRAISFILIIAVGMTFVIIGAGIDLSVGSVLALGGVITGLCLENGWNIIISVILGLLVGLIAGLINGIIVTNLGIPPMIATLGMMYIARGIVYVLTKGVPIYPLPDTFNNIGSGTFIGIPYSVYISLIIVAIGIFILQYTTYGRSILAIGGNLETARVSGINVKKILILSYIMNGILSAFVGVLMAGRLSSAHAAAGNGWEMPIIASVIIGGTSLFGGYGSIIGTVIGASIMQLLTNAMIFMNVSVYWQNIVVGIIIIAAVAIDTYKRNAISRG